MKIEAIDLFCGIGGLSFGLKQSGIKILAGLDNDPSCRHAYEKNTGGEFICDDIAKYEFSNLNKFFSKGSVKVLVGCAPCQPFSMQSNKMHKFQASRKQKEERWYLIKYFTKAVEAIEPDIVSMENVKGVTKTGIFRNFKRTLEKLGYKVNYEVVYCPDYGIPQNRQRLVLFAAKTGEIPMPDKTHKKENYVTVADTIKRLPRITTGKTCKSDPLHVTRQLGAINLARIRQSKPRGTWKDWDPALLPNCHRGSGQKFKGTYGRMAWDAVAPTITTQFINYGSGRFGHPVQDRALSIREGALLQTFPFDYDFGRATPVGDLMRHIGNAVPPKLGKVIGQKIFHYLEK